MLGIAHSFRQALESGASPEEIARNAGQSVHFVHNHLALTETSRPNWRSASLPARSL